MKKDIVQSFEELDFLLDIIMRKISKVIDIIEAQEDKFLTPELKQYRQKYLRQLHDHRRVVTQQQDTLLDEIEIKDIVSVLQKD